MKKQEKHERRVREIRAIEATQRDAAVAAKLLKVKNSYDPFWNISPRAPLVQRIGVGVIGLFFLLVGGCFFAWGLEDCSWTLFVVSLFCLLISLRPMWNAIFVAKAKQDR